MQMETENDFSPVLKPAIKCSEEDIASNSLLELYESKKNRLGLSERAVQRLLGLQTNSIKPILEGTSKQINLVGFIKLANFLGIDFDRLASAYLPQMDVNTIAEIQEARDAGYLVETFDLPVLTKNGFLGTQSSTREMVRRIVKFFNLESIYDYTDGDIGRAFSRTRRTSNDKMREFWIRSAYTQFVSIGNLNPYDREKLLKLLPKMKAYSVHEERGLLAVLRSLYSIGVTVIYQPCMSKEQVRGATMCVNGKPCVVISDLGKRYPTLWFALMHELYHVLYDMGDISSATYHISSDDVGDLMLTNEDKANYFAQQILLSDNKLDFMEAYINSKIEVERYARLWGIHPSIIYSSYCFRHNCWGKYNRQIPSTQNALRIINTNPFEMETLVESARKIKELLTV